MKKAKKVVYSNADDLVWLNKIKKCYKKMTPQQRLDALQWDKQKPSKDCYRGDNPLDFW